MTIRNHTIYLTPSGSFPIALTVFINAEADLPDLANGMCDGMSIYVGKKTIWLPQVGTWAIWVPEQPMELDLFGETLYVALCAADGLQLVSNVIQHAEWVAKTREAIGLQTMDSMLETLHMKFKLFVEPKVSTVPASRAPGELFCIDEQGDRHTY